MARSLEQLLADHESETSIEEALEILDEVRPVNRFRITALRNELLQELKTLRAQGSLF